MTDQPQSSQPNINELGAKFGEQLAQAYVALITLEKQLTAQTQTIQKMTKNEGRLVDDIQDLEAELIELKTSLEIMVNEPHREVEQSAISPAGQRLAQQGKEIIDATKKPPVGG